MWLVKNVELGLYLSVEWRDCRVCWGGKDEAIEFYDRKKAVLALRSSPRTEKKVLVRVP